MIFEIVQYVYTHPLKMNIRLKKTLLLNYGILAIFLASCVGNGTETRYLYSKPSMVIVDTLTQKEVLPLQGVSYSNHAILVSMPFTQVRYTVSVDNPFISKAYASRKESHSIRGFETITNMSIITLGNYSGMFPAGSDISDSCSYYYLYDDEDSLFAGRVAIENLSKVEMLAMLNGKGNYYQQNSSFHALDPVKNFAFRLKNLPADNNQPIRLALYFETKTPSRFGDTAESFYLIQ